jgi:hypothetical protein
VELVSRMMDGSISYDPKARLEPVSPGATVKQGDKIERLKGVRIFEECSQRQLRSIARIARVFDAPAGTMLTRADEPGDEFFLILDGTASVDVARASAARSVFRRDEPAGWRPSLGHNRRGDTGPPPRDQSPELLCASQGRARAHRIPLDDSLTARPAGRRARGTYGGRVGWVMRRGRHPTYAPGVTKTIDVRPGT